MKRVIIESPYRGDIDRNVAYARAALRDCLMRGEAPIASHLLLTQPGVLDDEEPTERDLGIEAGHAWIAVADLIAVYADHGISEGMSKAVTAASRKGITVELRYLDKEAQAA